MGKKKWTSIQAVEDQIIAMREAGKSRREIAEKLGLEMKQIGWWVTRHNRKKREEISGVHKGRGRKPAKTLAEYKYENKRLKMENELLRDFLLSTERE